MEEKENTYKEITLRSEEVQEVMGAIPAWILRWGITVLFLVVMAIVTGSIFFKYPDVIISEMTLTGRYPVAQVVARASGKIGTMYVTDGQKVAIHAMLAVIENPASTDDVLLLKEMVQKYGNQPDSFLRWYKNENNAEITNYKLQITKYGNRGNERSSENGDLSLGDIQLTWTSLLNVLHEYDNYYSLGYYPKKIAATRAQIAKYHNYYQSQQRQQEVLEAQFKLASQQYSRDSLLFARNVISPSEHETARTTFLQSRYTLESGYTGLENLQIQIGELEVNLLDMELQQAEKENLLLQNFRTNIEQLANAINSWELNYCLLSPIDGKVTFTKYWNENQFVSTGENVFTVVPDREDELLGRALLPIQRSGKVRTGQRVIIRFMNFPDQEFGIVNGVVKSISLVPSENNCYIEIALPDGLTTNYRKTLPVTYEMKASAEIVTEDLRLIERFFLPLKRVLKEGMQ